MFEHSFLTRYRMKEIIGLLEQNKDSEVLALINSPKYARALNVLSDIGCVKVQKVWGGHIIDIALLDKYATYQLQRYDLWVNRIGGFIFGVVSGVLITIISAILLGLLHL